VGAPLPSAAGGADTDAPIAAGTHLIVVHVDRDASLSERLLTGESVPATRVRLFDERTQRQVLASLCGVWRAAPLSAGQYVALWHVREAFRPRRVVLDDEHGVLLIAPAQLLSGSVVAKASFCLRRSLLDELFSAVDLPASAAALPQNSSVAGRQSGAAVSGQIMHELFQTALASDDFSEATLLKSARAIVLDYLPDLYAANMTDADAERVMLEAAPRVRNFATTLLARGDAPPVAFDSSAAVDRVRVERVLAIEESVASVVFGIKGKIDATVAISVDGGGDATQRRELTVPLELKTGKAGAARIAHRAQAMLYAALLAERRAALESLERAGGASSPPANSTSAWLHADAVPSGGAALLHYLNPDAGGTEGVRLGWHELCALVTNRNDIAAHLTTPPAARRLPPVLSAPHTCRSCVQLPSCALLNRAREHGDGSDRDGFYAETVARVFGTLSERQLDYFRHWDVALSLEEHESLEARRDVWSSTAAVRQRNGACFADMHLVKVDASAAATTHVTLYEFARADAAAAAAAAGDNGGGGAVRSLLDSSISVGDTVTLSVEGGPRGVLVGRVRHLSDASVVVASRDPLRKEQQRWSTTWVWRIDQEESTNSFRTLRANVVQLLLSPRLCRLLVDVAPPEFALAPATALLPVCSSLNDAQRAAIAKVRAAKDYVLIHGMPGTGKSTTIAAMVTQLVSDGQSVLLTAHTHAAVDNVLIKLIEFGISFMRLSSSADAVHPAVLPYVPDAPHSPVAAVPAGASPSRFVRPQTIAELSALVEREPIVAVTCLGVRHSLLARRRFDVCIVDEASQLTQPAIIGALLCADRFVLVGDHQQLPPIVRNAEARKAGLDVSLFRHLSELYASATIELALQYRMNDDIVALANALVYNDALRCGTDSVADARLCLPQPNLRPALASGVPVSDDWLALLLRPETTVAFLDTDAIEGARDSRALAGRAAASMTNSVEAELVGIIALAFSVCGLEAAEIGIVTPYRAQVRRIDAELARLNCAERAKIENSTVDKFQGRDKKCIIWSLVRSNEHRDVGPLLADWRRINVAVTRARVKLIVIGSASTACSSPALNSLVILARHSGWLHGLPARAHKLYAPRQRAQ
jgi:DNA replication ATP-dependent helicase Dna2